MRQTLLVIALGVTACGPRVPTARVYPGTADTFLDSARAAAGLPALAAIVVRHDTTLFLSAVGVRRAGQPATVTVADLFQLGSMTKAMTATMIAQLVDRGALSWDSRLAELFPELRDSLRAEYRDVTVDQVLGHLAGFPPYEDIDDLGEAKRAVGDSTQQRASFARHVLTHAAAVAPGSKHLYSNAGYTVLGVILERVTGMTYERLLRERLVQPLGARVTIGWPAANDPNQPWGHYPSFGPLGAFKPHDPHDSYQIPPVFTPAGGASMSLAHYGRFMQLHLNGMAGRDGIVSAAAIKHLHAPTPPDDDPRKRWALGWVIQRSADVDVHLHDGSADTFYTIVALEPERDLGVAVFTNAMGKGANDAVRAVTGALLRQFSKR